MSCFGGRLACYMSLVCFSHGHHFYISSNNLSSLSCCAIFCNKEDSKKQFLLSFMMPAQFLVCIRGSCLHQTKDHRMNLHYSFVDWWEPKHQWRLSQICLTNSHNEFPCFDFPPSSRDRDFYLTLWETKHTVEDIRPSTHQGQTGPHTQKEMRGTTIIVNV